MALANLPYITDRSATPVHHPSAASQQLGELPALTGLRFLAAFFVFIGHATPALVKFSPELVLLQLISSVLTSAGMTLFFTLSGFVIHYNYAEIVESPVRRNGARFFVARFARLYPLYAFIVAVDLLLGWRAPDLAALPFYLGLAQSWTYAMPDEHSLINHMHFATVTWSISTEWFFYCCYPLLAWLLVDGRKHYRSVIRLVIITLLWMALVATGYLHPAEINDFAGQIWGPTAADVNAGNDYFFAWLLGYSPIGHLQEFLVGVITAQVFILKSHQPVTSKEKWIGAAVLIGGMVGLFAIYGAQQSSAARNFVLQVNALSVFVLPIGYGIILFYCARYRSLLSAALSTRPLVVGGDASYSIYLFHVVAITSVAIPVTLPLNWYFGTYVAVRFISIAAVTIIVSIGMYRFYEVGMRIATRSFLNSWLSRGSTEVRQSAIIVLSIGIPLSLSIYGWLMSGHTTIWRAVIGFILLLTLIVSVIVYFARNDHQWRWQLAVFTPGCVTAAALWWTAPSTRPHIVVVEATYGENCMPTGVSRAGNWTAEVRRACRSTSECEFSISFDQLADPAPGCLKEFRVNYSCRGNPRIRTAILDREAYGKVAKLECNTIDNNF